MSELIVLQDCATVQLSRGMNALIDAEDWRTVGHLTWHAVISPRTNYAGTNIPRVGSGPRTRYRTVRLHRLLMGEPAGLDVDHKNGDGLDNRKANLRTCSRTKNAQNARRAVGASPYKGVSRIGKYWVARIRAHGKPKVLGCYADERDAALAYDAAARELFGEFACTNADIHGDY